MAVLVVLNAGLCNKLAVGLNWSLSEVRRGRNTRRDCMKCYGRRPGGFSMMLANSGVLTRHKAVDVDWFGVMTSGPERVQERVVVASESDAHDCPPHL
jgi:hypothetical protein